MVTAFRAEPVVRASAVVGEGPVWDAAAGVLWWVDIEGRRVHRFDPSTGTDTDFETPSMVGTVALRAGGGLVLALVDHVALVEPARDAAAFDRAASLVTFDDGPDIRSNDGKCDPRGRFLLGRMALDERPVGRLLSLAAGVPPRTLVEAVAISNGLAWSADGRTMFYIDTPTRRVDRFDYDLATGDASNRQQHLDLVDAPGSPDGMTIDADGCLWVALWGGSEVRRYGPDGTLLATVEVPASQVTSCTFGGADLGDLYITSAARGVDEPLAGALFRVRPGVRGVAADAFGG